MTEQDGRATKGTILVVEDDPQVQQMIARAATAEGFAVLPAFDGAAGLAAALTRPIDVVVLDIGVPMLDGRDVLSHLKLDARTAQLPVLVCSARHDEHSRRLVLQLGAVDLILKPFDPRALIARIAELIEERRAAPRPLGWKRQTTPAELGARAGLRLVGKKLAGTRPEAPTAGEARVRRPLRVLMAEDTLDDVLLVERELTNGGFEVTLERVQTRAAMHEALAERPFDLVISDHSMPSFDALDALAVFKASGLDLPFIVVSGTIDEAGAVIALKAGAHDFVFKGNLARLVPAVERELREARSRAEARRMEDQLMVSDRLASVGMLAAGIVHEINNPLAAVLGNLGMVCEALEGPASPDRLRDAAEAAEDAMSAAERVRQIVQDVKVFSPGPEERAGPVDVNRVLDSTLRMASYHIRNRARVQRRYGEVVAVIGSEQRLGQVFLNLIVNAAQAIPEGDAQSNEIRVSTAMEEGRVVVEVTDTGSGIPLDLLPRLFTAFVTTKPVGQGTGLGLTICRRLVTAMGGDITVQSEVGRGATFRVALPAARQ